ncbi:hypothetical protein FQN55_000392 [Onygenales sp. PD_40]|nr:hypothetical protein FQN55_000392 [Onygenales sp. PD_40]KAK2792248.1 hypothetical protein FQN52_003725 [Onygenales sp. PD_12]KAK2800567.1 hypothetical protein FQN51_005950 [Onygenales sp. PD_10]
MLAPFRIRDLLDPTPDDHSEQSDRQVQEPQSRVRPSYSQSSDPATGSNTSRPQSLLEICSIISKQLDGANSGDDSMWHDGGIHLTHGSPTHQGSVARDIDAPVVRPAPEQTPNRDGVVQISAEEYDETISRHPLAKLSYTDNDDGDMITVGSSFELTQQLSEPHWEKVPNTRLRPTYDPTSEAPMHIFDIQRSESVLDVWRSFEKRTSARSGPGGVQKRTLLDDSGKGSVSGDDVCSNDMYDNTMRTDWPHIHDIIDKKDDPRYRWFKSCNPPSITQSTRETHTKVAPEEPHPEEKTPGNIESDAGNTVPPGITSSALTEEGKKQAQKIGARIRAAQAETLQSFTVPTENPWASFSHGQSAFGSHIPSQREPESHESPIEDGKPLLAAFEAELSRIMETKPGADSNITKEIDKEITTETGLPPSPPPPPPKSSRPASATPSLPTPVEMLTQTTNSLLGRIGHFTSELKSKIPDIERRLAETQQNLPTNVETTVLSTLSAIGSQVQGLANTMQDAAAAARAAADKRREADSKGFEQVMNDLRNLARRLREMRLTLSPFETLPDPEEGQPEEKQPGSENFEVRPSSGENVDSSFSLDRNLAPVIVELVTGQPRNLPPVEGESREESNSVSWTQSRTNPVGHESTPPASIERQSADTGINTLFIGNVALGVTEKKIHDAFANKGFLGKVNLPLDAVTRKHAGFGYVEFPCYEAASGAMRALQGTSVDGQSINLEFSHESALKKSEAPGNIVQPRFKTTRQFSRSPDSANIRRPAVTFDDESFPTISTPNIRRAKSLGSLRRSHTKRTRNVATRAIGDVKEPSSDDDELYAPTLDPNYRRSSVRERDPPSVPAEMPISNTLLDQQEVDPEFSARYPSLSAMARFPTVSQFEARNSIAQQSQPGGKPEIGIPNTSTPPPRDSAQAIQPDSAPLPGSWPPENHGTQSLEPPVSSPALSGELRRSNTTIASDPAARLQGPFVPLTEHRQHHRYPAIRRSATERQHRRPLGRQRHTTDARSLYDGYRQALSAEIVSNIPGSFPAETPAAPMNVGMPHPPLPPKLEMQEQRTPSHIDRCLRQLELLGYGENRPADVLMIYARAANGNLDEAIEMIEEERKVYEQRTRLH